MKIGGYCCQCGQCCIKPAIATSYMIDGDSCRYLSFEDELAVCEFRTGRTEPERAYRYWKEHCVPFPRDKSDLDSVKPHCSYTWGTMARFYTSELVTKKFRRAGDAGVMV